jgi:hypothetical protein
MQSTPAYRPSNDLTSIAIYLDFGLLSSDQHREPDRSIEDFVILVAPILLSHEEIKEADEPLLTQHAAFEGYT